MSATTSGVVTDHITVLGNGTAAQPLHTGDVPVTADGTTILGNGTVAHPLHSGDVPVTADGTTILGNGTTENPLRQTPGLTPQEFTALFLPVFLPATPLPGTPVFLSVFAFPSPGNPPIVNPSLSSPGQPGGNGAVNGVIKSSTGSIVQVQTAGLVTLTTAQWDAVTGDSGGLVMGTTYYTSSSVGQLAAVRPAGAGTLVSEVGVGLNPTTLLITISSPVRNQDGFVLNETSGVLGNAVSFNINLLNPAVSDVNLQRATAIGVTARTSSGLTQTSGLVTLTPTQWAAITDTGGLVGGFTYYVDTSAHPGRLTAIEPSTGFAAQVGVALNTTTLILSTPCFPLVF